MSILGLGRARAQAAAKEAAERERVQDAFSNLRAKERRAQRREVARRESGGRHRRDPFAS